MATPEERLLTLDARFDTLIATLSNQITSNNERFDQVCRRLDNIRTWLIALTGLYAVQLAALVAMAIAMSLLGR
jgi:hypothetical protein